MYSRLRVNVGITRRAKGASQHLFGSGHAGLGILVTMSLFEVVQIRSNE